MAERSILELILRTRREGAGAKEAEAEVKRLTQASGELGKVAGRVNLGMLALKGSVLTASLAFLRQVPDLTRLGLQYKRAETALVGYAGSQEEATRTLELMGQAAEGALDKLERTQAAARFMAMGLADTAEEAARFTEIAITLGASIGVGPQKAIEDFSLMLANQAILRLDTFGMSGARARIRMAELARDGIEPADSQARFLIATLEEAERKLGELEAAGFDAVDPLQKLEATGRDLKIRFGEGLAIALNSVVELREAIQEQHIRVLQTAKTYEQYRDVVMSTIGPIGLLYAGMRFVTEEEWNLNQELREANKLVDGWSVRLLGATSAAEEASTGMIGLADSLDAIDRNLPKRISSFLSDLDFLAAGGLEVQMAFENVKKAVREGALTPEEARPFLEELFVAAQDVKRDMGEISGKEAARNVRDTLGVSLKEAKELLNDVDQGFDDLDRVITLTILYNTIGEPGRILRRGGPEPDIGGQHGLYGVVPPGFPNDSYTIGVSSGETVVVMPPADRGSGSPGEIAPPGPRVRIDQVNIHSGMDELAFETLLGRVLT